MPTPGADPGPEWPSEMPEGPPLAPPDRSAPADLSAAPERSAPTDPSTPTGRFVPPDLSSQHSTAVDPFAPGAPEVDPQLEEGRGGLGLARAAGIVVAMALVGLLAALTLSSGGDDQADDERSAGADPDVEAATVSVPRNEWEILLQGCDAVGTNSVLINGRIRNITNQARTLVVEFIVTDVRGSTVGTVVVSAGTVFPNSVGLFRELVAVDDLVGEPRCQINRVLTPAPSTGD